MMNYKPVEVVPFPFIEKPVQKLRPALDLVNTNDMKAVRAGFNKLFTVLSI